MRFRVVVCALTFLVLSSSAHAFPGANGRIAFTSKISGNTDIYTVDPSGGDWTRLTTNTGEDAQPTWSPDGTKIAFRSIRGGRYYETYVMNADGSDQHALTVTPNPPAPSTARPYSTQPSWSPDGSRIVFAGEDGSVYRVSPEGRGLERIPVESPSGSAVAHAFDVSLSPDGRSLVFSLGGAGHGIYRAPVAGGRAQRLTSGDDHHATWGAGGS